MSKFKTWCLKLAMKSLVKLDKDKDGVITASVKYDIETKKVSYDIK